jgi:hypothetical protein
MLKDLLIDVFLGLMVIALAIVAGVLIFAVLSIFILAYQ